MDVESTKKQLCDEILCVGNNLCSLSLQLNFSIKSQQDSRVEMANRKFKMSHLTKFDE